MEPWNTEEGRLLIVHGSPESGELLSARLKEAGYATLLAGNGREGLEVARKQAPDLVILDLHAPEMDAEQVLAALKAEKATETIPVILLAPAGENEAVEHALARGADDYLMSPYSATLLKAQIRDYLRIGRWRRQEQNRMEREDLLKIERDVQIARNIQSGFLPSELPQPDGWEVAARFYPAREVAGDFYDAFTLTQGRRVGLVIADVCDKGVGAALFMALFRSLIRAYSQQHYSMRWMDVLDDDFVRGKAGRQRSAPSTGTTALKNAMDLTNEYMVRNHADANMFATVFFGMLDPITGNLMYVNGGHNPPIIVSRNDSDDSEMVVRARLKPTGPAVGMFPDVDYKIEQITLEPGDVLFTYTDGVTDARDPEGTLFGEKRMTSLLLLQQPASAAAVLDRMDQALRDHIAEAHQFDDITMLSVRRLPVRQ